MQPIIEVSWAVHHLKRTSQDHFFHQYCWGLSTKGIDFPFIIHFHCFHLILQYIIHKFKPQTSNLFSLPSFVLPTLTIPIINRLFQKNYLLSDTLLCTICHWEFANSRLCSYEASWQLLNKVKMQCIFYSLFSLRNQIRNITAILKPKLMDKKWSVNDYQYILLFMHKQKGKGSSFLILPPLHSPFQPLSLLKPSDWIWKQHGYGKLPR